MKRLLAVVLFAAVVLAAVHPWPRADAATKYNPCSLLTAADLEAALRAKVDRGNEADVTIPDGPMQGETMSTCSWVVAGPIYVSLNVIRGPKNAQEQAAGLARLRAREESLKAKGWTVQPANIPGADCVSVKPPASEPASLPGASCVMTSKGLAFWLGVSGKDSPTAQDVKALSDKVAARLP